PGGMQRRPNANEFLGQDTSGAGGQDDLGRARADSARAHATFHAAHAAAAAPWPGCPSAVAHSSSALTTETMSPRSYAPMWPTRRILPLSWSCPPATTMPCTSRNRFTTVPDSMPAGGTRAVTACDGLEANRP